MLSTEAVPSVHSRALFDGKAHERSSGLVDSLWVVTQLLGDKTPTIVSRSALDSSENHRKYGV
jgi:hypothetical protein